MGWMAIPHIEYVNHGKYIMTGWFFVWFLGFGAYVRLKVMMSPITIFKDANQLGLGTYLVSLLCVSGWCWGHWGAKRMPVVQCDEPKNHTHTI